MDTEVSMDSTNPQQIQDAKVPKSVKTLKKNGYYNKTRIRNIQSTFIDFKKYTIKVMKQPLPVLDLNVKNL